MDSQKIYLLAEVTVLPEFLDDVKGALSSKHSFPRFKKAGCEGVDRIRHREVDPHKAGLLSRSSSLRRHISFTLNRTT